MSCILIGEEGFGDMEEEEGQRRQLKSKLRLWQCLSFKDGPTKATSHGKETDTIGTFPRLGPS